MASISHLLRYKGRISPQHKEKAFNLLSQRLSKGNEGNTPFDSKERLLLAMYCGIKGEYPLNTKKRLLTFCHSVYLREMREIPPLIQKKGFY